jgi:methyltransferase
MSLATPELFAGLVAVTALQRLAELVLSRRNLARLSRASRPADSGANWSALVALQVAWLAGSGLEPLVRAARPEHALFTAGLTAFLAGAALRLWCIHTLGGWWNARARVDPGLCVASHGPYRWIRHPNYLGVLLEVVGLPLAGGAWLTLALALPAHAWVLCRRIQGEDALLAQVPGYREAMGHKGALLPRWSRR